jgi:hypothetical protein
MKERNRKVVFLKLNSMGSGQDVSLQSIEKKLLSETCGKKQVEKCWKTLGFAVLNMPAPQSMYTCR